MSMRIVFLCLHWHIQSGSAKWFTRVLGEFAEVLEIPYDYSIVGLRDMREIKPDLVICWQTEQLVPYFLRSGIPAIAIPMADACANNPDLYFRSVGYLGAISTSNFIADRFARAGRQSLKLKYFPSSSDMDAEKTTFDDNQKRDITFFSPYRSKTHIEANSLSRFLEKDGFGRFHRHLATDEYYENAPFDLNIHSKYFIDVGDLNSLLRRSKYFIAPRNSEGIGLSTLRAMTFGCIPIGIDAAGNCEYFQDSKIGIQVPEKYFQKPLTLADRQHLSIWLRSQLNGYSEDERRAYMYEYLKQGRAEYQIQAAGVRRYLQAVIERHHMHRDKYKQLFFFLSNITRLPGSVQSLFQRLGL